MSYSIHCRTLGHGLAWLCVCLEEAYLVYIQAHTIAYAMRIAMRSSPLLCIALSLAAPEAIRIAIRLTYTKQTLSNPPSNTLGKPSALRYASASTTAVRGAGSERIRVRRRECAGVVTLELE